MHYEVTARFIEATASDFLRKLLDGTISNQKPAGRELVASMNRAVVTDTGEIKWSEVCHCSPPLAHERETVLDHHFTGINTDEIEGYQDYEGRAFMEHLRELADRSS